MRKPVRSPIRRRQPTQRRAQETVDAILGAVIRLLKRGGASAITTNSIPFTVLRRMDCVLAPTKAAVLAELKKHGEGGLPAEPYLRRASKASFFNTSPMDLKAIAGDPANVAGNLASYIRCAA